MKSQKVQAVRGMSDCLPASTIVWQKIESILKQTLASYGYQEIRTPIVEFTPLFKRAIGEVTDVVEKEMYTFLDRNEESLTLRPEGTAGCVRAGIEHGLIYNQEQRLWYSGPMFRYEKPQKGRYRQFHQLGVEVFGLEGPNIDAELMLLTARFWQKLGISDFVELEINSIGSSEARMAYRQALVMFLEQYQHKLDEDSKRRLQSNPLRILDSKNSDVQQLLIDAPHLSDYLDDESNAHFSRLCHILDEMGIRYRINPRLVRGLDYYNKTVFEWVTTRLGAQGAICAGGRYDGLVAQLGGNPTQGVGFAIGLERLVLLVKSSNNQFVIDSVVDIYLISAGLDASIAVMKLAEVLRQQLPNLCVMVHHGKGNFKKQFMRADKLNAKIALIVGEDELQHQQVMVKDLRSGHQINVDVDQMVKVCSDLLSTTCS